MFLGGSAQIITILHRRGHWNLLQYYKGGGVFPIYYNITRGRGGSLGTPKLYYVIYGRPLGGLRITFAQKSRVSRRCVPRYQWSYGRCVCCCLTYSFRDQYTIDNIAAPLISSITATALRATCHVIGYLAADVSSHLAGRATWMQYLQSIIIIRCLLLEPGQRNKWEPRGRIQTSSYNKCPFQASKIVVLKISRSW